MAAILREPVAVTCRRLTELAERRLLREMRLPVVGRRRLDDVAYTLARAGGLILSERSGKDLESQYRPGGTSYPFARHALAISDFRVSLEQALHREHHQLLFWQSEWQLRRLHVQLKLKRGSRTPRAMPFVPDALFGITTPHKPRYYFLEVDRGTARAIDVAKKIQSYIQFFADGLHGTVFRLPYFRALIVTTTSARMNGLLAFLRDLGRCQSMFLFVQVGRPHRLPVVLSPDRILGDVWRKCGDSYRHSLIE